MTLVDSYTYQAPTRPLRDWLRLQQFSSLVGGPGAATARIFASVLPGGCTLPAIAFHRAGGGADLTLDLVQFQFDCYAAQPEDAEDLAAALATLLVSTPARTRLSATLVFEGPAVIVDQIYLPVQTKRTPRQILRAQLTFASY